VQRPRPQPDNTNRQTFPQLHPNRILRHPPCLANGEIVDNFNFKINTKGKICRSVFYPLYFTFISPSELVALIIDWKKSSNTMSKSSLLSVQNKSTTSCCCSTLKGTMLFWNQQAAKVFVRSLMPNSKKETPTRPKSSSPRTCNSWHSNQHCLSVLKSSTKIRQESGKAETQRYGLNKHFAS